MPLPWEREAAIVRLLRAGSRGRGRPRLRGCRSPTGSRGYAVDVEGDDPTSTLTLYRRRSQLRTALWSAPDEPLDWLPAQGRDDVLAFDRGAAVCVAVCGDTPFELPADWGEIVLASARPTGRVLPGQSAAWLTRGAPTGD